MKNLRRSFERFCLVNRSKGIPNLMLYITIGNAIVYLMSIMGGNSFLFQLLFFNRSAILQGQVWRLLTYPLTMYGLMGPDSLLLVAISLFCYYSLGQAIERRWGTLKFNLFYLTGIVLMDVYCMIFPCQASADYLNMSLFLGFATMFPDASFLLFFIIPIKAWFFALVDLALVLLGVLQNRFPYNLFPIIALANYFLFFGKDVLNIIPYSWRNRLLKFFGKTARRAEPKVIQFRTVVKPQQKPDYTHRCTVCGRTDVTNPELEFRYCSRCNGYYCYCEEHINNHTHIQ